MAHYLITGGCGFIGSHLADALLAQGHAVRVIDNLVSGKRENLSPRAELVVGDICEPDIIASSLRGIDGCFHLAAVASVALSEQQWLATHKTNQGGTVAVLEALHKQAQKDGRALPLVFASSAAVYGNGASGALAEDAACRPVNFYGIDKLGSEQHAQAAFANYGLPSTGLRFFNVYGPRQNQDSFYSGVISLFISRILNDQPITIFGDGEQSRDFVYIEDVVQALLAAVEKVPGGHDIFNICSGKSVTINAIAEKLETIHASPIERTSAPRPKGDVAHSLGDPAKFHACMKAIPATSFDAGLANTYRSIKASKDL